MGGKMKKSNRVKLGLPSLPSLGTIFWPIYYILSFMWAFELLDKITSNTGNKSKVAYSVILTCLIYGFYLQVFNPVHSLFWMLILTMWTSQVMIWWNTERGIHRHGNATGYIWLFVFVLDLVIIIADLVFVCIFGLTNSAIFCPMLVFLGLATLVSLQDQPTQEEKDRVAATARERDAEHRYLNDLVSRLIGRYPELELTKFGINDLHPKALYLAWTAVRNGAHMHHALVLPPHQCERAVMSFDENDCLCVCGQKTELERKYVLREICIFVADSYRDVRLFSHNKSLSEDESARLLAWVKWAMELHPSLKMAGTKIDQREDLWKVS